MSLTGWLAREAKRLLSTASEAAGQLRSHQRFEHWGFWAVAVPAVLPPPFPIVPFLLAAGALQYSRQRFLAALTLGRTARYTILAYLGVLYGRHFLRFFNKYTKPTVFLLLGMSLIAALAALVTYWRYRGAGAAGGEVAVLALGAHGH
jgi:membrane protein DedA with SNARE-associated domain